MDAIAVVGIVLAGVRGLIELASSLGHKDAVLVALDAELAAHRALVDRALAAKVHDTERPK